MVNVTVSPTRKRKKYGAGAWPGSNPIGGGPGYVSQYSERMAQSQYIPDTAADLTKILSEARGKLIWLPKEVDISGAYGKVLRAGSILASDRSIPIKWGLKTASAFMQPTIYCEGDTTVSGIILKGASGFAGMSNRGLCGFRTLGRHVTFENCEISDIPMGGVWCNDGKPCSIWNDDSQRHIIRHSYIHDIMQHGEGYGVGNQGAGLSYLVEASIINKCRHLIMGQAGMTSYELRYCEFGDSLYGLSGSPSNLYHNQQVDCHGSDKAPYTQYPAGNHLWIWRNTFSDNMGTTSRGNSQNVRIRGIPESECWIWENWTKKTIHKGRYTETNPRNAAFEQTAGLSTYKNMRVWDNWYGVEEPPDDDTSPAPTTFELSDITVTEDHAQVRISAVVKNTGGVDGEAVVEVSGEVSGSKSVSVPAGASEVVVFSLAVGLK